MTEHSNKGTSKVADRKKNLHQIVQGWNKLETKFKLEKLDKNFHKLPDWPLENIQDQLLFLINYLEKQLQRVPKPEHLLTDKERALQTLPKLDLGKYLPWLWRQVMPKEGIALLLEDLPKTLDDLALFEIIREKPKFKEQAGKVFSRIPFQHISDVNQYTFETLEEIIKPFEVLDLLTPEDWEKAESFIAKDEAKVLLTSTEWPKNGFRLIRLKTWEAAKALGEKSRWCTSRARKWFHECSSGLFMLHLADGSRFQFHIGNTVQFRNVRDKRVRLSMLLDKCPGLEDFVKFVALYEIKNMPGNMDDEDGFNAYSCLALMSQWPEFIVPLLPQILKDNLDYYCSFYKRKKCDEFGLCFLLDQALNIHGYRDVPAELVVETLQRLADAERHNVIFNGVSYSQTRIVLNILTVISQDESLLEIRQAISGSLVSQIIEKNKKQKPKREDYPSMERMKVEEEEYATYETLVKLRDTYWKELEPTKKALGLDLVA